ncbi:MAG: tetratricopeptide repeat protein [Bacteroidota bacterium]
MKKIVLVCFLALIFFASYSQTDTRELLDKGINCITKKEYKKAIAFLDSATLVNPDDPEIYAHRGQAKHYLTNYKEAIEDYNIALRLQPDYAEVYHLRGLAKGELKDNIGACEDWEIAYEKGESRALQLIIEFCEPAKEKSKKTK